MSKQRHIELILLQAEGLLQEKESQELQNWVDSSEENSRLAQRIRSAYLEAGTTLEVDTEERFSKLKTMISTEDVGQGLVRRISPRWLVAAALLLAVGIGLSLFMQQRSAPKTYVAGAHHEPVILADGSNTWLSSGSTMSYVNDQNQRTAHLSGKAFFEIATDMQKPFVVKTSSATVTVTGTSFEVDASKLETRVLVLSGRVVVKSGTAEVELNAGDQITASGNMLSEKTPTRTAIGGWRQDDQLIFDGQVATDCLDQISKFYPIEFEFVDPRIRKCTMTGVVGLGTLAELLFTIERMLNVDIRLNAGKATVSGQGCETSQ